MIKLIKNFSIVVLLFTLFISCNNVQNITDDISGRTVSFDTSESIERDELVFLSLSKSYKLNDDQIGYDLMSFLNAKNNDNLESSDKSKLVVKAVGDNEKRYQFNKTKSFTKKFSNVKNPVINSSLSAKGVDENVSDDITFSIYNFVDNGSGKTGFALTSDDERIGSLLCVIEDCEYADDIENPLLDIFLSHLDSYVENVSNEWESITEVDYELFKEKYNITDEDIERARFEYESGLQGKSSGVMVIGANGL